MEILYISINPLDVTLPDSTGNFSTTLRGFYASRSQIKGHIPMTIGSFKGLNILYLANNNLTGNIQSIIGGLEGLQRLYLDHNIIKGVISKDMPVKDLGRVISLK
jgi:hypothetical protein